MKKFAIGVDIGGSHISCAVIDLEKNTILKDSYATHPVDNKADADTILQIWHSTIQKSFSFISPSNFAGIGFAMPSPFNYPEGIAMFTYEVVKYENLYNVNIRSYMRQKFSFDDEVGIRFMNDATAFAVGEAWLGKAANVTKSVSITLGTGFGSAFIDDGLPVVDRHDVPKYGCVWHLPYKNGIGDDYFSTRWFISRYAEISGILTSGAKEIADRINTDPRALQVFTEYGTGLADFLAPYLKNFSAEMLVIGGNISAAYPVFGSYFEKELQAKGVSVNVKISELMEDSAIIGSARMLEPVFWKKMIPLIEKM